MDSRAELYLQVSLLLAGTGFSAACSIPGRARELADSPPPARAATVRVAPQSFARRLVLQGELEPFQEVDVHAKVAGYLQHIHVDVGTRVQAGALLAELAVPEIEHERQQALATVTRRNAEFLRSEEQLRQAESAHQSLHLAARRLTEVNQSQMNLVAQQEVDDALGKDQSAEAQIAADRAALAAARAALQDAQANVGRVTSLLDYGRITAPFNAVVTRRYAHTGAMIPAGTSASQGAPLIRLSQDDPLRLVVPVPESAVPFVRAGTPVRIHTPALNRTFAASVSRCAGEVAHDTRTMRVEIDVANPNLEFAPGEYAEVTLELQRKQNVLAVPIEAVLTGERQPSVLVVSPQGIVQQRAVVLGLESPARVEVLAGLAPGDLVIRAAPRQFQPGQRVDPGMPLVLPAEGE